jgi:hypothetical protein
MAPANRGRESADPAVQVDPLGAIEALATRFAAWSRRVGEERLVHAVLAAAFVLAAALILVWGRGQTFVNDEWTYLVFRDGWSPETMLTPQNGHLILLPLLLYKALFATVGADSHLPFQVVAVALHLTVALLLFFLVRSRVPVVVALALAVLAAFFGAGWDTVMGAYELPNLTGLAAGLGMLLALERRTRGGDLAACLLLTASLASFGVGIAFAFGALLSIWLSGRRDWGRAWVFLVPAALYLVWFVWARKFGQSEVTAEAVSGLFSGIADQLAAICAAITGLFRAPGSTELATLIQVRPEWGYPLALLLVALVALHVRRTPGSIRFWVLAGVLLAYLALVAVGLSPARAPNASRYVYIGGMLTLLLVAELARRIRWTTASGLVAFVLLALSLMANVAELRAGGRLFAAEGDTNRATLAALELSRDRVDADLAVEDESTAHSHPDMLFPAWAYFAATDEFGSPAFSLVELSDAGSQAREAADQELVRALALTPEAPRPLRRPLQAPPVALGVSGGGTRPAGRCLALLPDAGSTGSFLVEVPRGGFAYRTGPRVEVGVSLGRFGDTAVTELSSRRGSAEVAIPADASAIPWRAELRTGGKTLICGR